MIRQRKVTLRGQRWTLRFTRRLSDRWGDCDWSKKLIRISDDRRDEERLDVLIHECLHAVYPFLDETVIDSAATETARVLWSLGYREQ